MRSTRFTKYAAITGVLAAPLLAAAPASATSGPVGSAYGISATGLVNLPATPSVTSAAKPHHQDLFNFKNYPVVAPSTVATVSAKSNYSVADIADLVILTPKVPLPKGTPKLPSGLVFAKVVAARCSNGKGESHIEKLQIADKSIKTGTSPNTTVNVSVLDLGKVTATVNKQVRNSDGTLTVTAVELNIVFGGKSETVDVSSATCGRSVSSKPTSTPPTTTPAPAVPTPNGEAPVPTPVKSDLPVTG